MKKINTITIAREYGAGGAEIAQALATHLGWQLLDRELIDEVARRAHVPSSKLSEMDEHPSSFVERLLKVFWLSDAGNWPGAAPRLVDEDYLAELSGVVIREAANLGQCVIVGRGAQCALRQRQDVFHVFVYASRGERLKRIEKRHPTREDCEIALDDFDRARAAYLLRHYNCDWADRQLYGLMINSDVGIDRAANTILMAAGLRR